MIFKKMKYHLTLVRMAITGGKKERSSLKSLYKINSGEGVEKMEPS